MTLKSILLRSILRTISMMIWHSGLWIWTQTSIKFGNTQVLRGPPDSAKEEVDASYPFNKSVFLLLSSTLPA
ncbi:MAG TPA: hypothetical protein VFH25_07865 [Nitrososphaeraceae archaeon]|nr:hypothetical protein [Nitrososphaeraceae archaeon]